MIVLSEEVASEGITPYSSLSAAFFSVPTDFYFAIARNASAEEITVGSHANRINSGYLSV
jgi:hypothetical protein